ncbi:3'-5' exonuclease [Polaromonas sp.]|uniref:3'-5' exonuclease n=1 Tax=Polaromonas sp. TaxID=1869339 RepID=UPI0032645C2F
MEDTNATATADAPAQTLNTTPVAAAVLGMFYDTETTGLPLWKEPSEHPDQPHLVELYAELVDLETREVVATMHKIVKPEGWEIPQECVNIHGITTERALAEGEPETEVIGALMAMAAQAEVVIAHNEQFDRRMVRIGIKRNLDPLAPQVEGSMPSDAWKAKAGFCTCWKAKPFTKLPGNKLPKLTEAYHHFTGQTMEGAHSASGDVQGCKTVYFAIKDALAPQKLAA